MRRPFILSLAAIAYGTNFLQAASSWHLHGPLKVAENRRFLLHSDGTPFFYLGDTAWELFHRLNREEATAYLEDRARKGFTVIQAVALAELDGLNDPNPYGHLPLVGNDPSKPDVKDGPGNDYWDHVDFIVNKAEELGLVIGLLPTWGDKWNKKWGAGPEIFSPASAELYGRWLGTRFKDKPIIWIVGGDRPIENDQHAEIIRSMAHGLRQGDGGAHLITFHPNGGNGSAQWFHNENWLDFNMRQNGHGGEFTGRYDRTSIDYARTPIKPVLDGEPVYEDHPLSFKAKDLGYAVSADVRRPLYWNLFSGAFGHTYGHHSVWQMYDPEKRQPINFPLMSWKQAIAQPGAEQMQFGRWLIQSRPFLSRIPDDTVLAESPIPTAMPGTGTRHFTATRDTEGTYAMIYAPVGRSFHVRMNVINAPQVKTWWYNPRNGQAQEIATFSNTGTREFSPPDKGELLDWVLVLDDASKNYPLPGSR